MENVQGVDRWQLQTGDDGSVFMRFFCRDTIAAMTLFDALRDGAERGQIILSWEAPKKAD